MKEEQRVLWPRVPWSEAVWESDLTSGQRLVALAYADHARDEATAWVTYERLMKRARLSRDTVARHMRALVESGWLTVERPASQHRAALYRLTYPAAQQSDSRTADGAPADTQQSDSRTAGVGADDSQQSDGAAQQSDPAAQQSDPAAPAVRPSDPINLPTPLLTPIHTPGEAAEAAGDSVTGQSPGKDGDTSNASKAEALTKAWWEQQHPKPAGASARPRAVASVRAVLKAGHDPVAVAKVLEALKPPLTAGRIEYALQGPETRQGKGWTATALADRTAHADHWAQPDATF